MWITMNKNKMEPSSPMFFDDHEAGDLFTLHKLTGLALRFLMVNTMA